MGVTCFFGNVGELDFGGGDRLRDASVRGHYVDSYVNVTDIVILPYFKKQCVVVPVSITSTKLFF